MRPAGRPGGRAVWAGGRAGSTGGTGGRAGGRAGGTDKFKISIDGKKPPRNQKDEAMYVYIIS